MVRTPNISTDYHHGFNSQPSRTTRPVARKKGSRVRRLFPAGGQPKSFRKNLPPSGMVFGKRSETISPEISPTGCPADRSAGTRRREQPGRTASPNNNPPNHAARILPSQHDRIPQSADRVPLLSNSGTRFHERGRAGSHQLERDFPEFVRPAPPGTRATGHARSFRARRVPDRPPPPMRNLTTRAHLDNAVRTSVGQRFDSPHGQPGCRSAVRHRVESIRATIARLIGSGSVDRSTESLTISGPNGGTSSGPAAGPVEKPGPVVGPVESEIAVSALASSRLPRTFNP
jgi:hypothetical protein